MSSLLSSLGRWSFRHRTRVVAIWLLALALAGGGAAAFGTGFSNAFAIPGSESQAALDQLERTFPEVSGASAQVVVVAADGDAVTDDDYVQAIGDEVARLADLDQVAAAIDPFDYTAPAGSVSDDEQAALVTVQLDGELGEISQETQDALLAAAPDLQAQLPDGAVVEVGGSLFATALPALSIVEAVGVLVALVVLVVTFGSFIAAGMPLVTALLGVAVSIALIYAGTALGDVSSTTPLLAVMLGLAVGIDYALFIISRHQEQVRAGVEPEESAARATGTAGSAVIFAGITVMIALVGLLIPGIPFLGVMGVAAALGVFVAVLIAVTMTPALLGFAGHRIIRRATGRLGAETAPSAGVAVTTRNGRHPELQRAGSARPGGHEAPRMGLGTSWVRLVTRVPALTIGVVVVLLGALSLPALGLRLALPDAGMLPADEPARATYDLVAEHFGEGANGPLIVTGTIVSSTDPVGLMEDLGDELAALDGVASVPLATPNASADTGIIQVVPETGPADPATADLVAEIRDLAPQLEEEYGVELAVTGTTAVQIDVSQRLGGALLPFGVFVIGLSLVLLTMVFRSVWVPVKAAFGYLLSVGAAFGVTALVFEQGVGAALLGVEAPVPVISFMPIVVMGVLFGLAMDYEVFLVSRMREDWVHNGRRARAAVASGFVGSARVVTAAAIIMFAVFAAFVPHGDTNIKPIALGLATGVFIDAFVVRMTLGPAVMALLGERAWWMPRWLDRALPTFDVEGEAVQHELALADWAPDAAIAARGVRLGDERAPIVERLGLEVPRGATVALEHPDAAPTTAALLAFAGRLSPDAGDLKVLGHVLPGRAPWVRREVAVALLADAADPVGALRDALAGRPQLVVVDGLDAVVDPAARDGVAHLLARAADRPQRPAVVVGTADRTRLAGIVDPDAVHPLTTLSEAVR